MSEEFINVEGINLKDLITIVGSYLFNGNDIDTIVASGKAYINGLNKLISKKNKAKDSKKVLSSFNNTIDKHVI